jgi:hypothetical protein
MAMPKAIAMPIISGIGKGSVFEIVAFLEVII